MIRIDAGRTERRQQIALRRDPKPLLHPRMGQLYREWVIDARAALAHEGSSNEAAAALRTIIEDIVLTPENGRLSILVKGELARLLAVTVPADQVEESASAYRWLRGPATN